MFDLLLNFYLKIISVFPNHGPTVGGTIITILGSNFGIDSIVNLQKSSLSSSCNLLSISDAIITCFVPPGESSDHQVVVISGSTSSNGVLFDYDPPVIAQIFPLSGDTQGSTFVTIIGSSFSSNGYATIGGSNCKTKFSNDSHIICLTPSGLSSINLVVVIAGGQSSNQSVTFSYNPPLIYSISPLSGNTDSSLILSITGTSFSIAGSVYFFNVFSGGLSTCEISNGQYSHNFIACAIPIGQGSNVVIVATNLQNSTYFSSISNTFTYNPPSISNVIPNIGATPGGYAVIITGLNFGRNGIVTIDGSVCLPINSGYTQARYFYHLFDLN